MRTESHPVMPEELMAYLDGELNTDRAERVSSHLAGCHECQAAAADLQGVSSRLREWTVETPVITSPQVPLPHNVSARWWAGWGWTAAAMAGVMGIGLLVSPRAARVGLARIDGARPSSPHTYLPVPQNKAVEADRFMGQADIAVAPAYPGPLIARSGSLTLRAHDFDHLSDAIDRILAGHKGYTAQVSVNAPQSAPRSLDATLRVPATEFESTITALKTLGLVQAETRAGEEFTRESLDLDARLANARNTEHRLNTLLQQRTGKLSDVLEVEGKIDSTRGEIERMEAQRKSLTNRVEFATIELHATEEYKAQLEGVRTPVVNRLRNAAVDGATNVAESFIDTASDVLSHGPVLLLWLALVFLPLRFVWRYMRAKKG